MEKDKQVSIHQEANAIARDGFGSDYADELKRLDAERKHARGCGCAVCLRTYNEHIAKTVDTYYRFQEEDKLIKGE